MTSHVFWLQTFARFVRRAMPPYAILLYPLAAYGSGYRRGLLFVRPGLTGIIAERLQNQAFKKD